MSVSSVVVRVRQLLSVFSGAALAAALVAVAAPARAGIPPDPVTFCGEEFNGEAILLQDLDCTDPAFDDVSAVVLRNLARLDLNGHKILKGRGKHGVLCLGVCEVFGGTIDTVGRARAAVAGRRRVTVDNVIIEGGWTRGVRSNHGVRVLNSIIRQARAAGVVSGSRTALIENSEITGAGLLGVRTAGVGVLAGNRAEIRNSNITGNFRFGVFVNNGRVILENSLLEENNLQIGCDKPELSCRDACDDTAIECQAACAQGDADCQEQCQQDNEECRDTCIECADIATLTSPELDEATMCETSLRLFPGVPPGTFPDQTWEVCTFD